MRPVTIILSICCFIGFLSPLYYRLAEKMPSWALIIFLVLGSALALYVRFTAV